MAPGYYVLGFGTEFIDIVGEGFIADGTDFEGFWVEEIAAYALELSSGIVNLVSTSNCDYYGVESAYFPTDKNFNCPAQLESNDVGIRMAYNHTLQQAKDNEEGFGAYFEIPEFDSYGDGNDPSITFTGR